MKNILQTLHGDINLPTFFPDATRGVIRGVDSTDLENCQIEGLVVSAYHLLFHGVSKSIKNLGGIHELMRWNKPIITDSGGFQVMSLIHDNPDFGTIRDKEIIFRTDSGEKIILTPEKSIQLQLRLNTDIAIVLDDCTRVEAVLADQEKSVERTIAWAKRSKDEFNKLTKGSPRFAPASTRVAGEAGKAKKPMLFAVIQGGDNKDLRKQCAQELIRMGFDGYSFGGFPVDENGQLVSEILRLTAKLLPDDKPKYALGVGKPENIVECFKMGYEIFDCVIPTREARHKKLYVFTKDPKLLDILNEHFYDNLYFQKEKFRDDPNPISSVCDCLTCQNYSRAYLYHLFQIGDVLSIRLAAIHNLRFYSMLMERLKE